MARPRLVLLGHWLPLPEGGYILTPAGQVRLDPEHSPFRPGVHVQLAGESLTLWCSYPRPRPS